MGCVRLEGNSHGFCTVAPRTGRGFAGMDKHAGRCACSRAGVGRRLSLLPFVHNGAGLTYELVDAMNRFQHDYVFQLVDTGQSRYRDMSQGAFQMMLFENIKWDGMRKRSRPVKSFCKVTARCSSRAVHQDAMPATSNDLAARHILAVTGYHYGFANFEADPTILSRNYRITFSANCEISLRNLLAGRGDVAVVTKSYLSNYLLNHREAASNCWCPDHFDQTYAHAAHQLRKGTHAQRRRSWTSCSTHACGWGVEEALGTSRACSPFAAPVSMRCVRHTYA